MTEDERDLMRMDDDGAGSAITTSPQERRQVLSVWDTQRGRRRGELLQAAVSAGTRYQDVPTSQRWQEYQAARRAAGLAAV